MVCPGILDTQYALVASGVYARIALGQEQGVVYLWLMSDYKAVELGGLDNWSEAAKRFLEGEIGAQFAGISVNVTEPGGESPFWHSHSKLEEIHIVLEGTGEIALDDEVLQLGPGSVVRVGQGVQRALRALPDSDGPMKWLCIRAGGDSLENIGDDADLDQETPFPWNV